MTFFVTKKQKQLMRERQRKKKRAQTGGEADRTTSSSSSPSNNNNNKKRPRPDDTSFDRSQQQKVAVTNTAVMPNKGIKGQKQNQQQLTTITTDTGKKVVDVDNNNNVVFVPANLTPQQAKKFRKDARRQARNAGQDDSQLKFITEGSSKEHDNEPEQQPKQKKRKREFPNLNQLVQTAKQNKEQQKVVQSRAESEARLSDEYKSRYLALDCEMVGIGSQGKQSALARVSLTDWHGTTVLDTFVQVPTRVTDFRTWVSGVKPKDIKAGSSSKAMEVAKCRETVAALLKGKVLVGHALKNDLQALMLTHPKADIRDTAKYRRFQRYGGNKWRPRKLRDLVKENLNMVIQEEGHSHDSVDDARAAMELFKLAREEWEQELAAKAKKQQRR